MKQRSLLIVTALSVLFALVASYLLRYPRTLLEAPDISLNIIDGRKIDIKSLRGKPLLVTFWATTCTTCLQEIPHLVELYDEFGTDGLEILGIAMSYDPPNLVVALSKSRNIPYPIALDINSSAAQAFGGVNVIPKTFLISPDGKITQQQIGPINFNNLRQKIKEFFKTNEETLSHLHGKRINALV